ncbi:hypothetical protein PISMIDRAFT_12633 [Pisolithus microcarpus 441]|uniref:Uncharacterized protein n=1 Tax=Pisolithus microcarpus 441 TaxID=765257 RepID=A0A0C9ZLY0_9AGAM|nr:hypothetical protein BKA83DRAFT_12633 [Pisolithus microcarpus]KIK20863.1 hypothetical protein PISMIDRAFT_12633 [Pisolithus microcarpus 441]
MANFHVVAIDYCIARGISHSPLDVTSFFVRSLLCHSHTGDLRLGKYILPKSGATDLTSRPVASSRNHHLAHVLPPRIYGRERGWCHHPVAQQNYSVGNRAPTLHLQSLLLHLISQYGGVITLSASIFQSPSSLLTPPCRARFIDILPPSFSPGSPLFSDGVADTHSFTTSDLSVIRAFSLLQRKITRSIHEMWLYLLNRRNAMGDT